MARPNRTSATLSLKVAALLLAGATTAHATFHAMQIEQVTGGVNGDTSAQAIQLRMRSSLQTSVAGASLVVRDAAGANPVTIIVIPSNVGGTTGDRILVTSSNFVNYTSPTVSPDFSMTSLIPTNYLAAGRLTWEKTGIIYWSLSWGGTNYTGPNTGDFSNDLNGNFGPPFPGPLPATSTAALLYTNTATSLSRSNVVDYIVTPVSAVFTNNARQGATVVAPPFQITSVTTEGNNIRISWTATAGKSYIVEATPGGANGAFSTNSFIGISPTNSVPGSGQTVTNYLDVDALTNTPARYYRIRQLQ